MEQAEGDQRNRVVREPAHLGTGRDQLHGDGLRLTLIGIAIGTAFGLALSRWLKSLLFGISATDAATLAGAIFVVFIAGIAATLIPARRASRIEIATMMREN